MILGPIGSICRVSKLPRRLGSGEILHSPTAAQEPRVSRFTGFFRHLSGKAATAWIMQNHLSVPTQLLVAEDHESARELISHALEGEGYDLTFVETGTEASSVLRQRQFDAALLDVALPGLSGTELCRRIKSQPTEPSTPVILMSGAIGASQLATESHQVGADAFLSKPFSLEELRTVLRAFTKIREQAVEIERLRRMVSGSDAASGAPSSSETLHQLDWSLPYHEFMKLARKAYFEHALVTARGNKSLLARESGLDRSTLYVHLRNLGMLTPRLKRSA